MHRRVCAFVAAVLMAPAVVWADGGLDFARSKQCLACHQVQVKRVGPSFEAIAERYGSSPGAHQYLAQTIREGSRGKWGAIPMPAQAQVGLADAQRLATWILSMAASADDAEGVAEAAGPAK